MNFIIPKKRYMNKLNHLTKKIYSKKFYNFVEQLGQRIFFITSDEESVVVIVSPADFKIDIFYGEYGFLTCHNFLSGDSRAVHTYGVSSLCIEEVEGLDEVYGLDFYSKKYKLFKSNNRIVCYTANKPGQKSIVVEEDEAKILINVLKKLILIQSRMEQKQEFKYYDEEMVCVYDFANSKKKYSLNYVLLETFDFYPKITQEVFNDQNLLSKISNLEIKSGVLYLGQVYGFNTYEIYENLTEFDIGLTPIYFYGITETGKIDHAIYSTPKEDSVIIFNAIAAMFFNKNGLYDTIVTDNLFIYNALCASLNIIGVDLKFEPNNSYNLLMTNFMIKMSLMNQEVSVIDEIIEESKNEFEELISESLDDLEDLNNRLFAVNPDDSPIIEEESDEENEFEYEDEEDGFIS